MSKISGAGCLAIAKYTVGVAESLACQTSRGAIVAISLLGLGPLIAHELHHSPQVSQQFAKTTLSPHFGAHARG